MNEIVFVTSNQGKLASAKKSFADFNVDFVSCDLNIIEPDIDDIEFISKYKVMEAYKQLNKPCIALDAGFYIPNYPGKPNFPGAFPKRELLNKIGIVGLLREMEGVQDRSCYFKECLSYYDGKEIRQFFGYTFGQISTEILGDDSDNKWSELWYVFIPKNCSKTMAQMTDEERKNRNDGHTTAIQEFAKWFSTQKMVELGS